MINRYALYGAWLMAMLATFGSLYYSEISNFQPCTLCWYQRVAVYPLAIILGMATYRRDKAIVPYAMALTFLGLFFAVYQVLEVYIPGLAALNLCGLDNNCKADYVNYFGFLTIPMLSIGAFLIILFFLVRAKK